MQKLNKEINIYIENCKFVKGLSEKTIKAYTIDLMQFSKCPCKNWQSKQSIENYIKRLYKIYKPKSARRKIASLKAFFRFLELEDKISKNPFRTIQLRHKDPKVLPKTIPTNILEKLFKVAYSELARAGNNDFRMRKATRNIAILEMLFATGMRVEELTLIAKNDIDLREKVVTVYGKGSKERSIYITTPNVIKALKEYHKYFKSQIEKTGYFFINDRGNNISTQSVRNIISSYERKIKSPIHITPHMFRHTLATMLLENNVDIRYIQEILGHSSITTTQIYTHTSMSAQRRILSKKHPRNKLSVELTFEG